MMSLGSGPRQHLRHTVNLTVVLLHERDSPRQDLARCFLASGLEEGGLEEDAGPSPRASQRSQESEDAAQGGSTAMRPELSALMCNLGKVKQGHLVLDPFCGTLSSLAAASAQGALTFGADVTPHTTTSAMATSGLGAATGATVAAEEPLGSHVELEAVEPTGGAGGTVAGQAKSRSAGPEILRANIWQSPWRQSNVGLSFDCILTDPPYGRRERRVGPWGEPMHAEDQNRASSTDRWVI